MALAHQIHRHSRSEDHEEDPYAGPDMAGVEVIAAGSVTSFVRKLFQMVQGECDSVVGFVAGIFFLHTEAPSRTRSSSAGSVFYMNNDDRPKLQLSCFLL